MSFSPSVSISILIGVWVHFLVQCLSVRLASLLSCVSYQDPRSNTLIRFAGVVPSVFPLPLISLYSVLNFSLSFVHILSFLCACVCHIVDLLCVIIGLQYKSP